MKKFLLAASCSLASYALLAQTREIAFKSHSGSSKKIAVALENEFFDGDHSDFGAAPVYEVKTAQLDSVIFISDSVAIMVTTDYCTSTLRRSNVKDGMEHIWKAGRQKVFQHPLFSKRHSLDSIRLILKQQYFFRNPAEKVVFVGYDNNKPECGENPGQYQATPLAIGKDDNNDQTPFGPGFASILSIIIGL